MLGLALLGCYLVLICRNLGWTLRCSFEREEQANLLTNEGICRINEDGSESIFRVQATTDITKLSPKSLWIIAVKYSNLDGLLAEMKEANVQGPLLFVQNGIGHVALANATDIPHIAFATIEHGALRTDDRTVTHNGVGMLTIGVGRGDENEFDLIETPGLQRFR